MKNFTLQLLVLIAGTCFSSQSDYISRSGGLTKLSGKGFVAVIDCRGHGTTNDYTSGVNYISSLFGIRISTTKGIPFSLSNVSSQLNKSKGNVAVFIADDASLPMTLSAPEEKWSMLNIARINIDNPDTQVFRKRLSLLFIRQCCRVLGADETLGRDSCFHSVFSIRDLDDITSYDVTMGPEITIPDVMKLRGIEKIVYGTYEEACMMGVAPVPTNDIQKAIWNRVHAAPKNPMKIEFDPKKGR